MIPAKIEKMKEETGLEISEDDAIAILRHFHWNTETMVSKWFDNMDHL